MKLVEIEDSFVLPLFTLNRIMQFTKNKIQLIISIKSFEFVSFSTEFHYLQIELSIVVSQSQKMSQAMEISQFKIIKKGPARSLFDSLL